MKLVGNTHLVAGGPESIPQVLTLLQAEGFAVVGNPDLYIRNYPRFGIDEARELRERASLRAVGKKRVFIIVTSGITTEAQNALLKTIEEPPADSAFFFIVSSPESLLPTLRSRAQTLHLDSVVDDLAGAKQFLAASIAVRLETLKGLLEKDEDDRRNIGSVVNFLASLERVLGQGGSRAGLGAIYRARKYIGDKGALVKPLLEQVALLVPHV